MKYWLLLDVDNPYRVAYYGGSDQDPKLPYMTKDPNEALKYPDRESAEKACTALFEKHERGFIAVPRSE
jgi:hypothetical protein